MSRPLRIKFEGAWYHVMNRGINCATIFFNDKHRNLFLNIIQKTKKVYGIEIHAYCLMTNHYHLIIRTPRGNISEAMKYLNSNYARIVNLSMKRDGPLFRGRFKAILICADDYLIRLSRYIHLNPLEAKIVNSLLEYKWSSYFYYIGKLNTPEWLSTLEIIKRFGVDDFVLEYKKFVENTTDKELDDFYNAIYFQPILGEENFRQMIDSYVNKHSLSSEIVGADKIIVPPSILTIFNSIASHFNIDIECVLKKSKGTENSARRIAIFVCRELGGYSLQEIASALGNMTYKAISSAINRVRKNPSQRKIAEALIYKIQQEINPS